MRRVSILYYVMVVSLALFFGACFVVGCAALTGGLDRTATAATQPIVYGAAGAVGTAIGGPVAGGGIAMGVSLLGNLWLALRGKKWKDAFTTVVNTVEPFIPTDGSPQRDQLKEKQGEDVTAMVKSVKTPTK